MTDVYIYYRIRAGSQEAAREAVERVFEALRRRLGVVGSLSRRVDDPLTWMETYLQVSDDAAFEPALSRAVAASDLPECVDGERHIERFVACA